MVCRVGPSCNADQLVELVASIGGCGQSNPAAGGNLTDRVLERGCWHMVALVDDNKPVAPGHLGNVPEARQSLQGRDVDDSRGLGPTAPTLAGLDVEKFSNLGAPLIGERLAIN